MFTTPKFWAGTPESLTAYLDAVARVAESNVIEKRADYLDPNEDPTDYPKLFDMQGEIGVISIKGSLTNSDSWINDYIGAVSYTDIRAALIYAANTDSVKAIVLDIQSGGGAVSGLADVCDLIQTIDTKVKAVYAYGDSLIASAAYRLGASARTLEIGRETEAGSLGVVLVHKEISKMMESEGVTATVIRSGKWKMLGNSVEPLSDLAKETLQAQVDKLNGLFVEFIAGCRKKSASVVESTMGGGRVFIGADALDVGLVDGINNFDSFMTAVSRGIDFRASASQYGANSPKGNTLKTALTEQQIAQAVATVADPIAETPALVGATAPNTGVVDLLQTQLAAAQAQVLQLSIDAQVAKSANEALAASAEKLRPAVRAAVGNLRIALGGTSAGVETLTDDILMAEHANLSVQFSAQFPAGGVAAVSSLTNAGKSSDDTGVDPLRQARLAATRNSK